MIVNDELKRPIYVGDYVAKGMRQGNSGAIAVGQVTEIINKDTIRVRLLEHSGYQGESKERRWPIQNIVILRPPVEYVKGKPKQERRCHCGEHCKPGHCINVPA